MEKNRFTEPKSGFVNVNGLRLHTLDWGGDGEPIVILHATGFLGRIYRPLAERLREIGHVYSYDQRGHGDSAASPDGNYDWTFRRCNRDRRTRRGATRPRFTRRACGAGDL